MPVRVAVPLISLLGVLLFLSCATRKSALESEMESELSQEMEGFMAYPAITFDAALTKGGRGDTAPAYIFARQLRVSGYKGQITIKLNDSAGERILALLSPEYQLVAQDQNEVLTIEDNIKVLRAFAPFKKSESSLTGQLVLRFALRPSEIRNPQTSGEASSLVLLGVFNLRQIPTSNDQRNRLVLPTIGYDLPDVGLGPRDLGAYGNAFATQMGRLTKAQVNESLIEQLQRDNGLYDEIMRLGGDSGSEARVLIQRNNRFADFFRNLDDNTTAFASVYGLGLSSVWKQFSDYVNSYQMLNLDAQCRPKENAKKLVLFYSTVLEEDTQKKFLNVMATDLRCPRQFELADGKTADVPLIPVSAGTTKLVMTGNFPHETYIHLLARSTVTNIVSGDNSVADALSLGVPFAMTIVEWNKISQSGVGSFLVAVAEQLDLPQEMKLSLRRMFDAETPEFLGRVTVFQKYPRETEKLFVEVRERMAQNNLMVNLSHALILLHKNQVPDGGFYTSFSNPIYWPRSLAQSSLNAPTQIDFKTMLEDNSVRGEDASQALTNEERMKLEVKVTDGLLYDRTGRKLNGYFNFVMNPQGEIYSADKLPHAVFFGGIPLSAAGEWKIQSGTLIYCNGRAKNYKRAKKLVDQLPSRLHELGIKLDFQECSQ